MEDPKSLPSPPIGYNYRPDIDGLRAVAVLTVLLFHVESSLIPGGFIGVDVFFVISGYLIGTLLIQDLDGPGISIVRFYARRLKRVLPALLVVMLCTVLFGAVYLAPSEMRDLSASAVAATFGASNIYFWKTTNYFNAAAEFKPLLATWSLGVEEQFYLIAPLLLIVVGRWRRGWLTPLIACLCLVSLAISVAMTQWTPTAAYFLLPSRWFELGAGFLLASAWTTPLIARVRSWTRGGDALLIIGLGLIGTSAFLFDGPQLFPGPLALMPSIGAALVIVAQGSTWSMRTLGSGPAVKIGLLSYSIYLWHWPLLAFARVAAGGDISVSAAIIIVALVFGLAYLTWRYVETPFRHGRGSSAAVVRNAVLAAATLAGIALGISWIHGAFARFPAELVQLDALREGFRSDRCLLSGGAVSVTPDECFHLADESIALVGDSHAAVIGPYLQRVAQRVKRGFVQLTRSDCPPLLGTSHDIRAWPSNAADCDEHNRRIFDLLRAEHRITTVVLSAFWSSPFLSPAKDARAAYVPKSNQGSSQLEPEILRAGLAETVRALLQLGKRVIVIGDVAVFQFNPVLAERSVLMPLRRWVAHRVAGRQMLPDAGNVEDTEAGPPRANEVLRLAMAEFPETKFVDPMRALCTEGRCLYKDGEGLLYVDTNHLSDAGAVRALSELEIAITASSERTPP